MTQTAASPRISPGHRISLVWIVPVVALAVGGWMMYRELRHRGPEITVHFPSGAGVEAGKTGLVYNGVVIGTVQEVGLEKDLGGAWVKVQLHQEAEAFARAGSQFWIVRPEVSFSGVRGLETLIAGVQLNGKPGSGPLAKDFVGLERQPAPEDKQVGRAFVLRTGRLGSLGTGSPVYYREVKVGTVETSRLTDDATAVLVRIRILDPYADLVRANTKFWNAGGVTLKLNLLGAQLKSTSMESLFSGGVGFATPEQSELAPVAEDGAQFMLYDEPEKDWLKWQPRIPIKPLESEPVRTPHVAADVADARKN